MSQTWKIETIDQIDHLTKTFEFSDYLSGLSFASQIGKAAESHDHHPEMRILYKKVQVLWTSHDVKGISDRDHTLAEISDKIFQGID